MIGVFDSGFGGLSVVRQLSRELGGQEIVYYADTKNFPYGKKTREELLEICQENFEFILGKSPDLIIVACNTVSSLLTEDFKNRLNTPVLDVVSSGLRMVEEGAYKKIGLIATKSSIKQGILEEGLRAKGIEVMAKEAQDLVLLAQEGKDAKGKEERIERALKDFKDQDLDALYLGCTHFPLISEQIHSYLGINLIDPAVQTARDARGLVKPLSGPAKLYFYSSDEPEKNKDKARGFLDPSEVVFK